MAVSLCRVTSNLSRRSNIILQYVLSLALQSTFHADTAPVPYLLSCRFDFVTEPSTQGAFLRPLDMPYRRKLPDQTHAVALAHLAGSRAIAEAEELGPQPMVSQDMVLPMNLRLKQELSRLYKHHVAGGRKLPQVNHPWVSIPEGNSSADPTSTSGRSLVHQINARGAVTAKLPPHPTKLGWATCSSPKVSDEAEEPSYKQNAADVPSTSGSHDQPMSNGDFMRAGTSLHTPNAVDGPLNLSSHPIPIPVAGA